MSWVGVDFKWGRRCIPDVAEAALYCAPAGHNATPLRLEAAPRAPRLIPLPQVWACERIANDTEHEACVHRTRDVLRNLPHTESPDISVDLGPTAATDLQLFVYGWPRHVSLTSLLDGALAAPPPPPPRGPPALIFALPYFSHVDPDRVARLLGWSTAYHAALGFQGAVMYVLAKHAAALRAHPGVRSLLASGRLRLVLWDEFAWLEVRREGGGQAAAGGMHGMAGQR